MREASRALERAGIKKVRPVPARSGASPEEAAVLSLPEPGQGVKVEERRHYFQQIEDIQEDSEPRAARATSGAVPQYIGLNLQEHQPFFQQVAEGLALQLDSLALALEPPLPRPGGLQWPTEPLHMTTFFLGGSRAALQACEAAESAWLLEGSEWELHTAHLIYLEGALLVMSLRVPEHLPMDPGCLPHVTLLSRPPFAPLHASEVLAKATEALLDMS
ncbi:Uncharacterized protein SCF082_LOCUS840 [Durusdinium trenchii]|uniref:Uncharacterized protein n=1 Tax=Durusdinium trenchii TaxID=1381693 RepID=A0ABP0HA72_9DINO